MQFQGREFHSAKLRRERAQERAIVQRWPHTAWRSGVDGGRRRRLRHALDYHGDDTLRGSDEVVHPHGILQQGRDHVLAQLVLAEPEEHGAADRPDPRLVHLDQRCEAERLDAVHDHLKR